MKRIALCTLALLLGSSFAALDPNDQRCDRPSSVPIPNKIHTPLTPVNAPDQWLWNNVDNVNYLTNMKN